MPVISFDRDSTVATGLGPVPMAVVERFIQHPDWRTYAHGNQNLVDEVEGITGMDEVRRRSDVVHESGAFAAHASESLRENRLRAIKSLEDGARRLVCVDDVDLTDLDDWEYYFPTDFLGVYPDNFFACE